MSYLLIPAKKSSLVLNGGGLDVLFNVAEIRRGIFQDLGRGDLARLARTCRAIFGRATDELWVNLDSLKPLLHCLDADFADREHPYSNEELWRLIMYTGKVHSISIRHHDAELSCFNTRADRMSNGTDTNPFSVLMRKIWRSLWDSILQTSSGGELFAHLRSLDIINVRDDYSFQPLLQLEGSHLTSVVIDCMKVVLSKGVHDSVIDQLLRGISNPQALTTLSVRIDNVGYAPTALFSKATALKSISLTHFCLDSLVPVTDERAANMKWLHVLKRTNLQILAIELRQNWWGSIADIREGTKNKFLPLLESLSLDLREWTGVKACECHDGEGKNEGDPAVTWACENYLQHTIEAEKVPSAFAARPPTVFFDLLDKSQLKELVLKMPTHTTATMLLDLLASAKKNCQLDKLGGLELIGAGCLRKTQYELQNAKISTSEWQLVFKALPPLTILKSLTLSLSPDFLDTRDDNLYRTMAGAMPHLEKLVIKNVFWVPRRQRKSPLGPFVETPQSDRPDKIANLAAMCHVLKNLAEVEVFGAPGHVGHFTMPWQSQWEPDLEQG